MLRQRVRRGFGVPRLPNSFSVGSVELGFEVFKDPIEDGYMIGDDRVPSLTDPGDRDFLDDRPFRSGRGGRLFCHDVESLFGNGEASNQGRRFGDRP